MKPTWLSQEELLRFELQWAQTKIVRITISPDGLCKTQVLQIFDDE
jgi:hypothetical protein